MTLILGDGPIVPLRLTVPFVGENRSAAGCDRLIYHRSLDHAAGRSYDKTRHPSQDINDKIMLSSMRYWGVHHSVNCRSTTRVREV